MTKHKKSRRKKPGYQNTGTGLDRGTLLVLLILVVILLAVVIWLMIYSRNNRLSPDESDQPLTSSEISVAEMEETESISVNPDTVIHFPYTLSDGSLTVNGILSSDVMNPDAGNAFINQLASLEVTNISGRYIMNAELYVTMGDGTVHHFRVQDLPANGRTIAFSVDNTVYDGIVPCSMIEIIPEYADGNQQIPQNISVSVQGTTVTLLNTGSETALPMTIYYHDTLDENEFYGGISYSCRTDEIPAGGSVSVDAAECIVGSPAVVRVIPDA
ncbi:MAG: hypothetical protein ACI3XM_11740 [Eubacteriales bacterium]